MKLDRAEAVGFIHWLDEYLGAFLRDRAPGSDCTDAVNLDQARDLLAARLCGDECGVCKGAGRLWNRRAGADGRYEPCEVCRGLGHKTER